MKIKIDPYKMCGLYIRSESHHLTKSDLDFILGSIRSRSRQNLSDPWRGLGPEFRGTEESRVLAQVSGFFKKNASYADNESCEKAAYSSFLKAETLCKITNKRLTYYALHPERLDNGLRLVLDKFKANISKALGSPSKFLDSIPSSFRITSGATESSSRVNSLPYLKVRRTQRVSPGCEPFVQAFSKYFGVGHIRTKTVPYNRLAFVPKTSDTHRTIACEPSGSLPFQLCFDAYAKKRLKRLWNVDLSDQTRNQEFARIGSIDGSIATIDLSMASDTLALDLIHYSFPKEWCDILCRLRSPHYVSKFGKGKYHKFSSMGNGTTFALETLVFTSLVRACGSTLGFAYGDDIIVESSLFDKVCRLLKFIGFKPNAGKSFSVGPFRESCGHDYHNGVNIRPVFVRKNEVDRTYLAHITNSLMLATSPGNHCVLYLLELCSTNKVPLVPYGDATTHGVFCTPFLLYQTRVRTNRDTFNLSYRSLIVSSKTRRIRDSRTYYLWFIQSLTCFEVESSVVQTDHSKVRLGWTDWRTPIGCTPSQVFSWEGSVARPYGLAAD